MIGKEILNRYLSDSERMNWLANMVNQGYNIEEAVNTEFGDGTGIIDGNFNWSETPEGSEYWDGVWNKVFRRRKGDVKQVFKMDRVKFIN